MNVENIINKVTRFLEEKEKLSNDDCLVFSKELFDYYYDIHMSQESDEINEEDDDFEDFEDEFEEPKKKRPEAGDYDYEPRKKTIIKSQTIKVKPVEPIEKKGFTQQDIDDGNF